MFTYDANGRRTSKISDGKLIKYYYAGDMLIGEEYDDESNTQYFGEDLSCVDADGFISGVIRGYTLEYYYGLSGVAGLVYNGAKYYFRRNVQGDITRIYSIDGTLAACYNYDAWGNHKVYDANGNENVDPNFVGNVNPFRYRGYYYDSETGLYYCGSRYYDPEVGRWINADDISFIDPETVNGLNLYAYCFNNPVMMVDDTGNKPKWWEWLLFGIGAALVVTAAVVLTVASGGAATGLIGAIAVGAAKGALIGAAVGSAVGIAGGAIYSSVTGADIGDSILSGFLIGFGGGAIIGAVVGGAVGGVQYTAATNFLSQNGLNSLEIKQTMNSFKGVPKVKALKANTTAYRAWGGTARELRPWVSPKNYGASGRQLLSIPNGNTMVNTTKFTFLKGTKVLAGKAAPLFGQPGGGIQWWISLLL